MKIRVTWTNPCEATVELDGFRLPYLKDVQLDGDRLILVQMLTGDIPGLDYWTPPESTVVGNERMTEYRVTLVAMSFKCECPLVIDFDVQAAP